MRRKVSTLALIAGALLAYLPLPNATAQSVTVTGAGSTWSQVAVDQWRADVKRQGLNINYQGVGSSAGRQLFVQGQTDFAVSDIPFEPEEVKALQAQSGGAKTFAYLPIVAGGTSLMYNLRDASNQPITTLRLSSGTLIGIFTGTIKNWSDDAIRADNPGVAMPDKTVVPVIRSDGSGTTAQFTSYLAKMEQSKWCSFAQSQGIGCSYTSFYPNFSGSVGQSGSDGVANYVHSESTGPGSITYVEAAYALQRGRPVAFLKNASGNFTLPTSKNVSIALERATLNADDTQNLDQVYVHPEPTAYAMSSYSYMAAPTNKISNDKGSVLGKFMAYFACDGQRKADLLGYSPLPRNLVEVVFNAIRKVPGAPAPPPIDQCNNPTITGEGGTSNSTASALSGGQSSSGTAPAGGGTGHAATGGSQASAGNGGGSGNGSGAAGGNTVQLADGPYATIGPDGQPLTTGSGSALALPRIDLKTAMPSGAPLAGAALLIALVVFGPPLFGGLLRRKGPPQQ